jgi:hypothetical protein
MEFEGTVSRIMPATTGTSARGPWQRQEVIFDMQTQSQYPRKVCVTFFNKPDDVARLHEGVVYTVSVDIESREYNGRWYTDVRARRVQPKQAEQVVPAAPTVAPAAAPMSAPLPTEEPSYATSTAAQEVDDLPF